MADKDLEDGDTVSSEDHDDQDFMAEENGEEMVDEEGGLHVDGLYIAPPPPPSLSFESQGPRLIISHIECENFKSFSGIQVLGPFHKNFTSIIGPNGSGKSNVIDAMLFVFGYRAQKIRSKKISVLIHSSSHFENIQSCKVTVFFQEIIDSGNEQHQVVPDSLFKVSRSAFRDNSSFYEIDGKKSLFKDVARLLRSKGVDLDHNRFLILQGEVEQIALMKPKAQHETDVGMLEFLEDIIGSSRFKEPIRIIQQRIGDIDELRVEKVNRVKIVEKEKEDLEKPKNEAVQYLIQKNEIARKKNLINQYHVSSNEAKLQNIQKKQAEFVEGSKLLLEKMKEVVEKKASKETELKHLSNQLTQMNKDVDEKSQLFQKNELQHGQLLEEMRNTNVHRKRLGAQLKAEQDHYAQLVKVPEDNQKKIAELTQHKSSLEAELAKVSHKHDEELTGLHKVTKDFQDKQDKLETELIDLQKETSLKESQYNVAKSGLDFLLSTEQKELCKLKQLQEKATTSRSELQNRESQLAEYSDAFPLLRKTVASMETELNSLNQKYESSYKKVSGIRGEVEEKRSKQTATKHWGAVHDALMRQKHAGTIPGIFGRLGDLGAIDRQYDVAVSTAAGSSLDTILVDSIDTAKACIEYLKRNDVGRANLLALDKTNRWTGQVKANFKGPENAPRLIDLIKLENESFRTAFYQYMRDTLVAKDMEQARRIAFGTKRYRVVTLSGEVIETSGAMAGGGKERLQGKMGSQIQKPVNETDLHQLEKALQSELSELDSVTESKARLEQQLVQGKRDLVEKDKLMAKLKLDVKKLQDDCVTLKAQMEAQQRVVLNSKPDLTALQQKQGEVDELKKELDVAAENSAQVKDRVLQLNNKIKEITSSKMKPLKAKLDNLTGQLDKVKQEMTRLEVGISSSERDMKKSKDKCDCYQTEVIDAENKLRQIKETRDTLEQSNLNIAQELKGLKQEEVKLEKQQKVLRDQLSKIESEETQCKSEHINFEQALSTYTEQIKECKKRVALLKQELASLRLEELPDGQQVEGLCTHTHNELQAVDIKALTYQVELMVEQMSNLHPNLSVIDEYTKKKEMYLLRLQELDQITARRDGQKRRLDELRKMRLKEFMLGFGLISSKLKETYQMITLGGDAELELIDRLDPFSEGILFSVRPPNKSWKNMSKLSGGEKTLSSLALVFALHYYKPTPLYVMDEIDAALDFKNVSIVALYIKEKTKNAQFVVISLRPNMFELADRLVGICKPDNCTKAFTINPAELIR